MSDDTLQHTPQNRHDTLFEKYGDGTLLTRALSGDASRLNVHQTVHRFFYTRSTEEVILEATGFLNVQTERPSVSLETLTSFLQNCLYRLEKNSDRVAMLEAIVSGPSNKLFDHLFGIDHIKTTWDALAMYDEDGKYFPDATSIQVWTLLVHYMKDVKAFDFIAERLVQHDNKVILNIFLNHPLLKDQAYERLCSLQEEEKNAWKRLCPDFVARQEKEGIWQEISDGQHERKPPLSKKM